MQLRESSECLGQSCVGAFLSILRNDCSRVIGPHPAIYKKGNGLAYIGRPGWGNVAVQVGNHDGVTFTDDVVYYLLLAFDGEISVRRPSLSRRALTPRNTCNSNVVRARSGRCYQRVLRLGLAL